VESKAAVAANLHFAEQAPMKRKNGFTLVELIISLTLFTVLVGGVFYAFGSELRLWRKIADKCQREQVANLVAERICHDIRAASAILTSSGSEEIDLRVGSENISYRLVDYKIRRKKGSSIAYLTNEREVDKLAFSYPVSDRVEMIMGKFSCHVALRN